MKERVLKNQQILIIGANSGIAKSLAAKVHHNGTNHLILVSRDLSAYNSFNQDNIEKIQLANYSPDSIEQTVKRLEKGDLAKDKTLPITRIFICHGILHTKNIHPEKRLEDISLHAFEQVMNVNTITPLLWIKALTPLLTSPDECKITVFSARVGSINDNHLGGWYCYRASKAALNMLLKTAAIELARRAKNIKLISFHPGTTDTELSKPFQKNVPNGKLFTCDFVADKLLAIIDNTPIDGELSYLDWQGEKIAW